MITRNEMTIYFGMPSLVLPVSSSETQRQWLQVCGFLNPTSQVVAARRCHYASVPFYLGARILKFNSFGKDKLL